MRIPGKRRNAEGGRWLVVAATVLALGPEFGHHSGAGAQTAPAGSTAPKAATADEFSPEAVEFFETRVRPILAESCLKCHGEKKQSSELRLDSRQAALEGGANGPALVPGNPAESLLIQVVSQTHEDIKMPPKGKLPEEAIAALKSWVKMGAPWTR